MPVQSQAKSSIHPPEDVSKLRPPPSVPSRQRNRTVPPVASAGNVPEVVKLAELNGIEPPHTERFNGAVCASGLSKFGSSVAL
jgi:hypothetical protein